MDGFGWLMEKRCRLMREYGWSADYAAEGITGAEGWAYYAWSKENEVGAMGRLWQAASDGYVRQEWKQRMAEKGKSLSDG